MSWFRSTEHKHTHTQLRERLLINGTTLRVGCGQSYAIHAARTGGGDRPIGVVSKGERMQIRAYQIWVRAVLDMHLNHQHAG